MLILFQDEAAKYTNKGLLFKVTNFWGEIIGAQTKLRILQAFDEMRPT